VEPQKIKWGQVNFNHDCYGVRFLFTVLCFG
jgi:hypothetical protein